MKRRHKWRNRIFIGILLITAIALIVKKQLQDSWAFSYSENWVNYQELDTFLSFTGKGNIDIPSKERLTTERLEQILEQLGLKSYIIYPKEKEGLVRRADFVKVYDQILDLLDQEGIVKKKKLLILSRPKGHEKLETQDGTYTYRDGEALLEQYDCIQAYVCKDQILGIADKEQSVSMKNAYIKAESDHTIQILYRQEQYSFPIGKRKEKVEQTICDIEWKAGKIWKLRQKEETIEGNLLSLTKDHIEIEGYGRLEHDPDFPVYKAYGTIEQVDASQIVLGNMRVRYVVGDHKVCGALMQRPADLKKIRVLLLGPDGGCLHPALYVTSDQDYCVQIDQQKLERKAGELTDIQKLTETAQQVTLTFLSTSGKGRFYYAQEPSRGERAYEGQFEVRKEKGGFALVNELELEKYLYYVVPSEMPSEYPLEALKVQALCARSYAIRQMEQGDYREYGAHVDDSVNYQVYNKQDTQEQVRQAVDDTCSQVLTCNGEVIDAYYFSTSIGYTEDMENWNLPAEEKPYLRKACLNKKKKKRDLHKEKAFERYIRTIDPNAYEKDSRFYRWNGTVDFQKADAAIKNVIAERLEKREKDFEILDISGRPQEFKPDQIGAFCGLKIKERSHTGCVRCMEVEFENAAVEVRSEYNIRRIMACGQAKIVGNDQSEIDMAQLFVSAFFTIHKVEGMTYQVYGGGYGHGIGMSQYATGQMAQEGMDYRQIISVFYKKIKIKEMEG